MPSRRAAETFVAVVLGLNNTGDSNRVVHLFGASYGRVGVWARHARGSRRRLAGVLEPFYTVRVTAALQGALYNLHGAEVVHERSKIRTSLPAIARAANLCQLVRALWPEHQAAPAVFAGLEVALDHVAAGRVARAAGLYPRLAQQAGLLPPLQACSRCAGALGHGSAAPSEPALWCAACAQGQPPLHAGVLAGLRGERIEDAGHADAVEAVVMRWLAGHVGRPLRPWRTP